MDLPPSLTKRITHCCTIFLPFAVVVFFCPCFFTTYRFQLCANVRTQWETEDKQLRVEEMA